MSTFIAISIFVGLVVIVSIETPEQKLENKKRNARRWMRRNKAERREARKWFLAQYGKDIGPDRRTLKDFMK